MAPSEMDMLYAVLPPLPQDEAKLVATLPLEELRAWAFHKMNKQSKYALSYRYMYNETSPINRLPTELLTEIVFLWTFFGSDPMGMPSYEWMARMGVCRRWRGIALSTALLWTKISTGIARTLPPLHTFLARSGACMIDVRLIGYVDDPSSPTMRLNPYPEISAFFSEIMRSYAERVQSLDIKLWFDTDASTFHDYLLKISQKCVSITALQLACMDGSIPICLDLSSFQKLRRLTCSTQIRIDTSIPTRLTSLTVVLGKAISVTDLLSLLRCTPSLESICISFSRRSHLGQIEDFPASSRSGSSMVVPKIRLPSLRSLDFHGSQYTLIKGVLSQLCELRASITIIESYGLRTPRFPVAKVAPPLIQACREALNIDTEPGVLSIEDTCGATSCVISGEDKRRWSVKVELARYYQEDGAISTIIPDIVKKFQPLQFRTLHVLRNDGSSWREPLDWRATFVALPYIETLKVFSDDAIAALWKVLGQQDEVAVPLLASIECHLKRQRVSTLEHTRSAMVECLAYRKQRGAPVRSLGFEAFVDSLSQADRERHESVRERLTDLLRVTSFEISVEEFEDDI
ncbi:hypothetical protein CERSUDRAFT_121826 [Gelatoporia subvermispora B]|uniref:Uncharacterized protein n=1 Tax=Ceriporiopsis subvermispora (strain B) TaxID=914234 RepID=M2RM86_CERS8|nr:hypothetical protein CERSUDRAFT_121826 [Gelatoporia subvermispora B]